MISELEQQLALQSPIERPDIIGSFARDSGHKWSSVEQNIAAEHLRNPFLPARIIAATCDASLDEVISIYRLLRDDEHAQRLTASPMYSRRLMSGLGRSIVQDRIADPNYYEKIDNGEPVSPRDLEVHATKGSCDYTCGMCLWSNKTDLTYRKLDLTGNGLLERDDWTNVFDDAQELGTRRIIFSGGGEPLLNPDLMPLVGEANERGLLTQLYSNGFAMRQFTNDQWNTMLAMERVRFSMHGPTDIIYNRIVDVPEGKHALSTVGENIQELLRRRNDSDEKSTLNVGIGFVIQDGNVDAVEDMVDFATDLGVDCIQIRQDEVSVTRSLGNEERSALAMQLSRIRRRLLGGDFGDMNVDISDDLTAQANGAIQSTPKTGICSVQYYRPAVSPYGLTAACDLRAEPRFADAERTFGVVTDTSFTEVAVSLGKRVLDDSCDECMPSGKTLNAVAMKLQSDAEDGIALADQPFAQKK